MAADPNTFGPALKRAYTKNQPNPQLLQSYGQARGRYNRRRRPNQGGLVFTGKSAVNTVASGAGSQRKGQRYRVAKRGGRFFHVYGHGPNARFVPISPAVAKAYGYTSGAAAAPNKSSGATPQ